MTQQTATTSTPRRVLATRNARWAGALARWLASAGVRPNAVSVGGVVFAAAAAVAFALVPSTPPPGRVVLLVGAAACIQLRLLCNLLDGMLAVEQGLKSKTGDVFNELPDRIADILILVAAGYTLRMEAYGITLGWAAALLAVFTAYVRVFAGSLGLKQHFIGPMAKQHRMFTLTVATLLAAIEAWSAMPPRAIRAGLVLIIAGAVVTAIRRIQRLVSEIEAR